MARIIYLHNDRMVSLNLNNGRPILIFWLRYDDCAIIDFQTFKKLTCKVGGGRL